MMHPKLPAMFTNAYSRTHRRTQVGQLRRCISPSRGSARSPGIGNLFRIGCRSSMSGFRDGSQRVLCRDKYSILFYYLYEFRFNWNPTEWTRDPSFYLHVYRRSYFLTRKLSSSCKACNALTLTAEGRNSIGRRFVVCSLGQRESRYTSSGRTHHDVACKPRIDLPVEILGKR